VTVLRCENIRVEVAAHIDSQGIAELVRNRSKRRASLVVARLVQAGVDPARLSATGYGGERPAENRAHNERIEFVVK
jgi:outer membrane protein OmpA-like peptidoglycan-associated protein